MCPTISESREMNKTNNVWPSLSDLQYLLYVLELQYKS